MAKVPRSTTVSVRIDQATARYGASRRPLLAPVYRTGSGAVDAGQQTHIPTPASAPLTPPRDTSNDADPL